MRQGLLPFLVCRTGPEAHSSTVHAHRSEFRVGWAQRVVAILLLCDWPAVQVLDDGQEYALGVLELPLCQILPFADLTLEQRFQLDHSGLDSLISMRLVLRVNLPLSSPPRGRDRALCKVDGPNTKYLLYVGKKLGDGFLFSVVLEYYEPLPLQVLPLSFF